MNRKLLLLITLIFSTSFYSLAQYADISGVIKDIKLDIPLQSKVTLKKENEADKSVVTGFDGRYRFSGLTAGDYIIEVQADGYIEYSSGFSLSSDESRTLNIYVTTDLNKIDAVEVRSNFRLTKKPGGEVGGETLVNGPYDNVADILATDPALIRTRNGVAFGDARQEQTKTFQNGVSQIGPLSPLTLNVAQARAISKGVPVMYGDFTGGVLEITTASSLASSSFFRFQLNSSQPFNRYDHNSLETSWYNPLIKNDSGITIMGITHSLYFGYKNDPDPFIVPLYKVKPEIVDSLNAQPFETNRNGTILPDYFFYNDADFNELKRKQNAQSYNVYNQINMQYNPKDNLQFALQSSFQYTQRQLYSFSNSLFNSEHNPLLQSFTGKANLQMSHQLIRQYDSDGRKLYDSTNWISKLNYNLILDYQRYNAKQTDPFYGDDIFNYGYLGKFNTKGADQYEFRENSGWIEDQYGNEVYIENYHELAGYSDTALYFTPANPNDLRSSFTRFVMSENDIASYSDLQENQGLLNGQNPSNVYSMWYAPGTVVSNYAKTDVEKVSVMAMLNLSLHPTKDFGYQHDIQFGFLFENNRTSNYSLNANSIWTLMPQLLNSQFVKLDTDNPLLTYDSKGTFTDTVNYNWIVDPNRQSHFDQALRAIVDDQNGHKSGNAHFIDVQSVDPSQLSIDMFTADELMNNGNSYVSYSGYDYQGNLKRGNVSLNDFLLDPQNRSIGAFNPIYTALWVQDKFTLDEIVFRAGLRVERYDANQNVLRDPFSLYPVKTVAEVTNLGDHPNTMGDDYVVYVDDAQNPSKITGYRNGRTWYDANGTELNGGEIVRSGSESGRIQPYLVDPSNQSLSAESFEDYQPQIQVLPRLSLSFPITREAVFFANYDQFAQRPNAAQSFTPISSYYYLQNTANRIIANPDLKPSKRTDYQVGFRQLVGKAGFLSITAGYAEIRDDINLVRIDEAYPVSYTTYGNLDFSTVKSFKVEYDTKLEKIFFRTSYMLQYADGTGSNVNSAQALIASNQPNLRSLYPLEYDVRHKVSIQSSIDLFELGEVLCSPIFRNMQFNMFLNAQSGTPFTAYQNAVPEAQNLGLASRSQIKGNPFGSRLPWNYTLDLSLVKRLEVGSMPFEIQLNAKNILNTMNIFSAYPYSGQANNDGYLSSPAGQQQLNNEVNAAAFAYLYSLKQLNPGHFGAPRMISITCRASF
ncbi:TonB-dependent receptor [bacterium]|nr:TonB-dependent receptor [bacterium]